jgi:hypothetical protein
MGWRFTATQPGLTPRSFWGLRRPVLVCAAASEEQQQQQQEAGQGPLARTGGRAIGGIRLDQIFGARAG